MYRKLIKRPVALAGCGKPGLVSAVDVLDHAAS
eukprot:COSAG06_NODE_49204_length_327_cov_0.671053_2_plen_32_part_01